MKRILVCGGRAYGKIDPKRPIEHPARMAERRKLRAVMADLLKEHGRFQLIHGGARGADALAGGWASEAEIPTNVFPADWTNTTRPGALVKKRRDGTQYDALAGIVRNQKMLDEGKPSLVVAFPGGSGTKDMVDRAKAANVEVMEIE